MVTAIFCTVAQANQITWHHHWNCIMILLSLLSLTPCGAIHSLGPWITRTWQESSGGAFTQASQDRFPAVLQGSKAGKIDEGASVALNGEAHGDETSLRASNWAKPLITFHFCLIYFWAGVDKLHWNWVNGSALYHLIHTRAAYDVKEIFTFVFPSDEVQYAVLSVMTVGAICTEILVPFCLWSKRFHVYAVA